MDPEDIMLSEIRHKRTHKSPKDKCHIIPLTVAAFSFMRISKSHVRLKPWIVSNPKTMFFPIHTHTPMMNFSL